nr:MAG TPA: hypothetical protein [Caudoviricetes sp.]
MSSINKPSWKRKPILPLVVSDYVKTVIKSACVSGILTGI